MKGLGAGRETILLRSIIPNINHPRGSLNHYHHHGMRFPRPRSVGKDSQGATTGSDYTVVPPSPCLRSPLAPPHVLSNNAETHGGPPPSLLCTCTPVTV